MYAQRPVRRTQLICPFGVGAMVDFRGPESLLTAGLDAWPNATDPQEDVASLVVREDRLEARLGVSHFRLPPAFDEDARDFSNRIPFVRFPCWHYCPRCNEMQEFTYFQGRMRCQSSVCSKEKEWRRPWLLPVRIITVCAGGHIDDFPFFEWVHKDGSWDKASHHLKWSMLGNSSSLSAIKIECSCNRSRTLAGSFEFSEAEGGPLARLGIKCRGARPWFGQSQDKQNGCSQHLRVVQRGASNVYFAVVRSSIFLPTGEEDDPRYLKRARSIVEKCGNGTDVEEFVRMISVLENYDQARLRVAVESILQSTLSAQGAAQQTETAFRFQEFRALTGSNLKPGLELQLEECALSDYGDVARYFSVIRMVKKLRETRVLTGFTRLNPPGASTNDPVQRLSLNRGINWLPASVVRGEGLFLQLNEELLARTQALMSDRILELLKLHVESVRNSVIPPEKFTPGFFLLHTLAHALIRELTFECGYGTSSLRERLYFSLEPATKMSGLLIYTASGDSEGTMGGLVRQGKPDRLIHCVKSAVARALWCSGDPVCLESNGQGTNNTNLAACHGCILLPETSCEESNRMLDRQMLVGTLKDRSTGYFYGIDEQL